MEQRELEALLSPKNMSRWTRRVYREVERELGDWGAAFRRFSFRIVGTRKLKWLAGVDLIAERAFKNIVYDVFDGPNDVQVLGEESLTDEKLTLADISKTYILIDMIDGTDLFERELSNWCSAITVFRTDGSKVDILGAFVALPHVGDLRSRTERKKAPGVLYFATKEKEGAFKRELRWKDVDFDQVRGPSNRRLRNASVCMYGQKGANLLHLLDLGRRRNLIGWLKKRSGEDEFRFYDLAGNPMMVKLADGVVDVVLDMKGQQPHDVVPGAYIALKAGAVLRHIDGSRFSIEELAGKLVKPAHPDNRVSYILAANKRLAKQLKDLLSS